MSYVTKPDLTDFGKEIYNSYRDKEFHRVYCKEIYYNGDKFMEYNYTIVIEDNYGEIIKIMKLRNGLAEVQKF
jgi:hypothetical protein